ncbi:MAG: FAD:protein FMN transferase [Acidimicrobiales bacterium]
MFPAGSEAGSSSWAHAHSHGIEIVRDGVYLPPKVGIDSGGIGKGLAADVVVEELLQSGAAGVCVNLGGDLRAGGVPPDGSGWTIAVDHPWAGSSRLARKP